MPVFVSRAESLAEVLRDITLIGEAVGRSAEATRLSATLRGQISAVEARYRDRTKVRALLVVWSEPLVVAGAHSHLGDLLTAAGGENVAADAPQPFPTYSVERAMARAPEVIIVGSHGEGSPPLLPLQRILETGPAGRRPRVVPIDRDLLFRPGPRLVDAAALLERALHPGPGDGGAP